MSYILSFLILGLYVTMGTIIVLLSRRFLRKNDPIDYFIASHNLSGFVSALTYAATTYSAFMMIGLVGLAYATGIGALGFELAYLTATLILLSFVGPKLWSKSRIRRYVSPSEYLSERYGSRIIGALATVVMLIALVPYASIQIIGPSLILERTSGGVITYSIAILVTLALSITWSVIGGLRGVAWTDAFQGILMLSSACLIVLWVLSWAGISISHLISIQHEVTRFPNSFWSPTVFIAYTIPWMFFALSNPQVVQRIFIPKDGKAYRSMVLGFAVFGFIYTILTTILGLLLRGASELGLFVKIDVSKRSNWNLVTPLLLSLPQIPTIISVIVGISILAAAVTTIDSIALTLGSMISRDVYLHLTRNVSGEVLVGKIIVILICLLASLFAYLKPGFIVDLAVTSSTILLPFAILFIGGTLTKIGKKWCALTTISVSILVIPLLMLKAITSPIPLSVIVLLLSLTTYCIIGLIEYKLLEH